MLPLNFANVSFDCGGLHRENSTHLYNYYEGVAAERSKMNIFKAQHIYPEPLH